MLEHRKEENNSLLQQEDNSTQNMNVETNTSTDSVGFLDYKKDTVLLNTVLNSKHREDFLYDVFSSTKIDNVSFLAEYFKMTSEEVVRFTALNKRVSFNKFLK